MVSLYFSSSEYSEFISDMMMAKLIKGFNLCLPSMSSKLEISDITASHFSFKSVLNHTERTQVELSPKGIYAVTVLRTSDVPLASDILLKMLKTPLNLTIPQGEVRLIASEFNFETSSFQNMVEFADEKFDEAKSTGIPSPKFQPIFYRYGSKVDDLTKHAYNTQGKYPVWESKWIESEVLNAIHKEDATSLHDFYAHRSTQLYFEYEWVDFSLPEVAEIMRIALKWTPEQTEEKIQYFRANFLKEAKA
jgi:hypothetical protein